MNKSGQNLIILGVVSVFIAITTTTVSLIIYHDSGDIYLDRSRPGFLPDKDEIENRPDEEIYKFSDEKGKIEDEEIEEYLLKLEELEKRLEAVPDPFSPTSISDETLNISE